MGKETRRYSFLIGKGDDWLRHVLCDVCLDRDFLRAHKEAGRLIQPPQPTPEPCLACGERS